MIPIDQQIRRRNSLLASYSSSSISSPNTIINTTTTNTNTSNNINDIIQRRMSLPGSLRPLKKRRVVSITDFQDESNAALTLSTMNSNIMNNVNNSDVVMMMTTTATTKKNVSWNDLNGNIIHSPQDDYHNHVFNERDIWYTVSIMCVCVCLSACLFVCLFICLCLQVVVLMNIIHIYSRKKETINVSSLNSQTFFLLLSYILVINSYI
jgi:hypothetical protein